MFDHTREEKLVKVFSIHISIQELIFDGVGFLPDFSSALHAVSINTPIHLREKI